MFAKAISPDLAPYALMVVASSATTIGRTFLKIASGRSDAFLSPQFAVAALGALAATGCWLMALRLQASIIPLAVLYSVLTLIMTVGVGATLFGEDIDLRVALGVACAIASVALLAGR